LSTVGNGADKNDAVGNAVPSVPHTDVAGIPHTGVPTIPHADIPSVPSIHIPQNATIITPTEIGKIIIECWNKMSEIDENVSTDKFCLMPNHIHGIIIIKNQPVIYVDDEVDINTKCNGIQTERLGLQAERRGRRSLRGVVRGFKSVTTRRYNHIFAGDRNGLWQSSYYDRVIRNKKEYEKIAEYIENNPKNWQMDKHYKYVAI
jgi:REP element-mobilizing transposase RayT